MEKEKNLLNLYYLGEYMNKKQKPQEMSSQILVGHKNTQTYVLVTLKSLEQNKEVTLRARGSSIVTAVTTLEMLRHRYLPGIKYEIESYTDDVPISADKPKQLRPITAIEIRIHKK